MAKKKSKKRIIILVIAFVVVALLVFGYIRIRESAAELAKTTYDVVSVQRGTIEVKVKGAGSVQPLNDDTVYSAAAGTVENVFAENGDIVSAGNVIAVLKNDSLESERDSLKKQISDADAAIALLRGTDGSDYVKAAVGGTLSIIHAKKGDYVDAVVDKYGALAVINPDKMLKAVLPSNASVSQGDEVTVSSNGRSVTGTVIIIDAASGEMTVFFDESGMTPGENATVTSGAAELGQCAIEIANPVYVTGRGGRITSVYESAGSSVSKGDNLFRMSGDILSDQLYSRIDARASLQEKLDTLEADLKSLTVKAGTDGVISGLNLRKDENVQPGAKLFTIKSNDKFKIDVDIDELDIANIITGQRATVTLDALQGGEFTATVLKINPIGVSLNNVTHFTVTLEMGEAEGIMLGMSAELEIISKKVDNVLYVPVEAIQIINGEKYIAFERDINKNEGTAAATQKVTTGVTDGVNIEITSGLSEGDRVAVPQAKSLSLQEQQMQMFSNRMNGGNAANTSSSTSAPELS